MPDLRCPECQSDQTQRIDLIYQGGTTTGAAGTRGIGVAIGEGLSITPVFGSAKTASAQQTGLASQFSPPVMPANPWDERIKVAAFFIVMLCLLMLLLIAGGASEMPTGLPEVLCLLVIASGVVGFLWIKAGMRPQWLQFDREARSQFERNLFWWHNTYFCHRCGHRFSLPGTSPPPELVSPESPPPLPQESLSPSAGREVRDIFGRRPTSKAQSARAKSNADLLSSFLDKNS